MLNLKCFQIFELELHFNPQKKESTGLSNNLIRIDISFNCTLKAMLLEAKITFLKQKPIFKIFKRQ